MEADDLLHIICIFASVKSKDASRHRLTELKANCLVDRSLVED